MPSASSRASDGVSWRSTATTAIPSRSPARSWPQRSPDHTTELRAITLNIGAAAPARATRILRWLGRRGDDLVVLTETSSGPGTRQLIDGLRQDGYRTYSTIDARDRGALIATRLAVSEVLTQRLGVTLPWRAPAVLLDLAPAVAVVGVYVPSRDRSEAKIARKRAFIASLLDGLRALPEPMRHHLLLVGDYNAVARRHDPPLRGLLPYEYALHDTLEDLGLQAAHELTPARRAPSSRTPP